MACNVFISYSTADLAVATQLKRTLEEQPNPQFSVFLAESSIKVGENLPSKIMDAIRVCNFFVLLWSANADSSKWVPQEVGQAVSLGKPIFPVLLKEGATLPAFISNVKFLRGFKGEDEIKRWIKEELNTQASRLQKQSLFVVLAFFAFILWLICRKEVSE